MRTLKKTLALVLVLAMVFSLCITASADFTDADEIENELAVYTLEALGVIEGMDDGSFSPNGTLTRAQGAAILCRMLGYEEYIEKTETSFTDVPESHWASGYIALCTDLGIINGYGDGKFGPSDELTNIQWAKMLLVAFDPIHNWLPKNADGSLAVDFTLISWRVVTAQLAIINELWAGDEGLTYNAACTRDAACLHAYNALPVSLLPDYKLAVDEFGNDVADQWGYNLYDADEKNDVVVLSKAISAVETFTKATSDADILKAIGAEKAEEVAISELWVDGVIVAEPATNLTANGAVVKLYADDNEETEDVAEYKVVVINTYAAQLAEADITEADAEKEIEASVKLDEYSYSTDKFAEGDIVLYTVDKSEGKVMSADKAAVAEGKVTSAASNGSFKVDGAAAEFAACSLSAKAVVSSTAMNIYRDAYGYIVAITDIKGEIEEPGDEGPNYEYAWGYMTNYKASAYVEGVEEDYWNNVAGSAAVDAVEKIEITNAAGETKVYDGALEVVFDEETKDYVETKFVNKTGAKAGLVKYALTEDGKVADVIYYAENVRDYAFVTGNATMTGAKVLLDANTIAFVVGDEVAAYVGYEAIPSFDKSVNGQKNAAGDTWEVLVIAEADLTEEVEEPAEPADPTESTAYVLDASWVKTVAQDDEGKDYDVYTYTVVVDGKDVEIKATSALAIEAGKMYTLSTAEDGYTTVKAEVEAAVANVTAVAATYFKAGSVYYTTKDTVYYVIGETVAAADGISAFNEDETVATAYIFTDAETGKVNVVYYTVTPVEAAE